MLALSIGLSQLIEDYEVDPVLGLLALARAFDNDLEVADEPR